jgi:PST family polysaccharide transporter
MKTNSMASPDTPGGNSGASYGQILKSSSIIGGASGINYLIGMVRTKLVAVLLGPSGIGLVALYTSVTAVVSTLSGLGIASSGVREVSEAHGSHDPVRIARVVKTLRRVCWLSGLLGWLLMAGFAVPISRWTFGNVDRAGTVAILGVVVLIGAISNGQKSLIQGSRRIADLARLNVMGMAAGTVVAVLIYGWLGERGIVPVLILVALINLLFSWWFARKIPLAPVSQGLGESLLLSKGLVGLGLAFMWSALLGVAGDFVIRSMIVRELGLDANGIYQSAWGISGMFAGFILGAMGSDYYPRLAAVSSDHQAVNRLVNEQTEIGILLALPGLLGTLAFAPWMMRIFYSAKFLQGAELLPWFVLGVFGQVVTWPMGFVMMAKGAKGWFAATETFGALTKLLLSAVLLKSLGLIGISVAFACLYFIVTIVVQLVNRHLTGFQWSRETRRLLGASIGLIAFAFAADHWLPDIPATVVGALLTACASIFSLRGIVRRLGAAHRMVRSACRLPGVGFLCGIRDSES